MPCPLLVLIGTHGKQVCRLYGVCNVSPSVRGRSMRMGGEQEMADELTEERDQILGQCKAET